VLVEHSEGLNKLAKQLLEKEVIFSEDLEAIFGKRKYGNPHDLDQINGDGDKPKENDAKSDIIA
jgi:cell division protease FtsH